MNRLLLVCLSLLCFGRIGAQTITADLLELNFFGGSYPMDITVAGSKVYFSATEDNHGRELWVHDLENNDTYMVKDINAGYDSSIDQYTSFTMVGNILYFVTTEYMGVGRSIWRSDGTEAGTYLIKAFDPDYNVFSNISHLIAFNGNLYFTANDGINGDELWLSNGTPEGTNLFMDINPGTNSSQISHMFVFNNGLYFAATSSTVGREIWKSDGTPAGTVILKDINPGPANGTFSNVIVLDQNIYFIANDGTSGMELWKSDGTAAGTSLVKQLVMGLNGVYYDLEGIALSGKFVFYVTTPAGRQLWKSDGSAAGTTLIKQINPAQDGFEEFGQFVKLNNSVYFTAGDNFFGFKKLWKSDGTVTGTQQVIDLNSSIYTLTASDSYLIFACSAASTHSKTWISNGTAAGTGQLNDLGLTDTTAGEHAYVTSGNITYYPAGVGEADGIELWKTDGTNNGTNLIKDISHSSGGLTGGGAKTACKLNDNLIFLASDVEHGLQPYVSDGTPEGTHIAKDENPANGHTAFWDDTWLEKAFVKAGAKLFYKGRKTENGYEIFCTDGTDAGTHLVKDIAPGNGSSLDEYTYFMEYNGIFYFKANDQVHGDELWRSDGTEAGTYLVKDIYPGSTSGVTASNYMTIQNAEYAVFNGLLYFKAGDETGLAIWRTDGTEAGTVKVLTPAHAPVILGATTDKLFFATNNTGSTYGVNTLWSTDGTESGTMLLATYNDSDTTQFEEMCIFGNEIYYKVYNNGTGLSIIKSDGTIDGTILVIGDIPGTFANDNVRFLKPCGDYIYFLVGNTAGVESGSKIWRTDGTPGGTVLIDSGMYQELSDFICQDSDMLYLKYTEPTKLWYISNENFATSTPIEVIVNGYPNFGNYSSVSGILGLNNGKIFLEGTTQESGRELYIADFTGILGNNDVFEQDGNSSDILIYPNPTDDIVNISSRDNSLIRSIEVCDLAGKKILDKSVNDTRYSAGIMAQISKGIYLLRIKTDKTVVTKKIIRN